MVETEQPARASRRDGSHSTPDRALHIAPPNARAARCRFAHRFDHDRACARATRWPAQLGTVAFHIKAHDEEKTWLLAALGALLLPITALVIWQQHDVLVSTWTLASIAVPWVAITILLRFTPESLGFEGKYVDWWSIPHFVGGVLFGLLGVPLVFVIAIATAWELVEVFAHTREHPTNRVTDILLAGLGWLAANALAGGTFSLL